MAYRSNKAQEKAPNTLARGLYKANVQLARREIPPVNPFFTQVGA